MESHEEIRGCSHIGAYKYEITKELGAGGNGFTRWSFTVYKTSPTEKLMARGEDSPTQEHAERNARQLIALYMELDRAP